MPDQHDAAVPVDRLLRLRQHERAGTRSPHKPLLVLLALGQLDATGTSELRWSSVEQRLAALITEFGPQSRTTAAQSAAYPFTRLRSDGVWTLDGDVPMDLVRPLRDADVTGRLIPEIEVALVDDRQTLLGTARALAESEFPPSIAGDVLMAAGFDPDEVGARTAKEGVVPPRRRDRDWPARIIVAWERQCAFCGFDGVLGTSSVGLEAAHVRWFTYDGPDDLDNGLALCALHHKLFDRGVIGLSHELQIEVSPQFTSRTDAGRRVYDLHGVVLQPRRGTSPPSDVHIDWHRQQVFRSA